MVSVVIPVRDGERTIARQLDALAAQSAPGVGWEVVVADNGSRDATVAIVDAHPLGDRVPVRVAAAGPTRGVNVARNAGVAAARGELVLLCDADDRVRPGWIRAHTAALLGQAPAVAAGPLLVDHINPPRWASWGPALREPYRTVDGFACGWGANMALHRRVWVELGGFDESYRSGWDEVDLFARAHASGTDLVWVPDAVVDYVVTPAVLANLRKAVRIGRSETRFFTSHPSLGRAPVLRVALRRAVRAAGRGVSATVHGRPDGDYRTAAYELGRAWGAADRRLGRVPASTGSPPPPPPPTSALIEDVGPG